MKTTKFVKATLGNVGYVINAADSLLLEPTNLAADGTLTYIDETGNSQSVLYPDTVPVSAVTAIYVTPENADVVSGDTQQLAVIDQDGDNVITSVTFSSSDEGVATVDAAGLVTAVTDSGSAIITATYSATIFDTSVITATT